MEEFEALFHRYVPVVHRFLLALCQNEELAEELTTETFYRAYLHIGQFRGDCRIETWLCQIAKHALYKEQLHRKRNAPAERVETAEEADRLLEAVCDRQQALALHKKLHGLPEPYREVFQLRIFGELRFAEIAAIFDKTESWAKVTFYRAKEKLVKAMEEDGWT